jgi:hypothetical protein
VLWLRYCHIVMEQCVIYFIVAMIVIIGHNNCRH